jgi:hypothetical protein
MARSLAFIFALLVVAVRADIIGVTDTDTGTIRTNTPPVAGPVKQIAIQNGVLTFDSSHFSDAFSDTDGGTFSGIKVTNLPTHGRLAFQGSTVFVGETISSNFLGALAYYGDDFYGRDTGMTYKTYDGTAYSTNDAVVTIVVNARPVMKQVNLWVNEGDCMPFYAKPFVQQYSDPFFGDGFSGIQLIESGLGALTDGCQKNRNPFLNLIELKDGCLRYCTPGPDFYGNDYFRYKAYDGYDYSKTAVAHVTVNAYPYADCINIRVALGSNHVFTFAEFARGFHDRFGGLYDGLERPVLVGIRLTGLPANGNLFYSGRRLTENDLDFTIASLNIGKLVFRSTSQGRDYSMQFRVSDGYAWSRNTADVHINVFSNNQ